jgi:putative oxidoreductase
MDPLHLARFEPQFRAILRIVVAFLFIQHGTAKYFGVPHVAMFDGMSMMSLVGVAGAIELVGGALVLIGLFTRVAAFILSGEMAVAYFMGHASHGGVLTPIVNMGESAVLFCFVFLYFAAAGAGPWSVDAARARAKS